MILMVIGLCSRKMLGINRFHNLYCAYITQTIWNRVKSKTLRDFVFFPLHTFLLQRSRIYAFDSCSCTNISANANILHFFRTLRDKYSHTNVCRYIIARLDYCHTMAPLAKRETNCKTND